MKTLGIDPGTKCGWAILDTETGAIQSGVWDLGAQRHEGGGMRFVRLQVYLNTLLGAGEIGAVFYEEVHFHAGTAAAHVYGGIVAIISSWCEARKPLRIPYRGINVATVKKFATGKGNAKKDAMIAAAEAKWPADAGRMDDNEADARFVAACGAHSIRVQIADALQDAEKM